eukprot:CAMPEP_0116878730 /NCGR_PEP_ID=MMETSP0463-20121206/10475_1 /TAXON_ID=181622 /ORGANISM="Strombidinopsis sp, Strain SopsisLIS2011" /LENGTH=43 /DNA_ID= /DNA_START= /DNA_END= /DNA_ORIENTATION=
MTSYADWLASIAMFNDGEFGFGFGAAQTTSDYFAKFYTERKTV